MSDKRGDPSALLSMEHAPRDGAWIILIGQDSGEPRACAAFWSEDGWYESEAASRRADAFFSPIGWLPFPDIGPDGGA